MYIPYMFSLADWMAEQFGEKKTVQSGRLFVSHDLTEEEKKKTEILSGVVKSTTVILQTELGNMV